MRRFPAGVPPEVTTMAEHAAAQRRNWLVALGAAAVLLILLALTLSFCDDIGNANKAGPATTATTQTLPPVSGPAASPGTLSPKQTSAKPTGNDPTAAPAVTTSPVRHKASPSSTKRTPTGGVDAGGGSGLTGRRAALLVAGVFLLLAALVTARFAVGRAARD
jgi:hypothetical protein